ncbi:hypothetical protein D104_01095 [Marinomonas profundimaris]|uniref:Uncharacterized protein n=2 Tax=Marinomonas profundimaris TaxID=1208321 RepID=W1S670_9GAMM|nr:hypothetical protein D104_01095 [Marinomonas profundimaris]
MDVLNQMIKDIAKISLQDHYDRKKVVLIEHGTTDSSLELHNVPNDAIVIDIDSNFNNGKIFSNSKGECKRADYIIVSEEKKVVVFIEMKKGASDTSDIIKQLKGSFCLFKYCQIVASDFFGQADFMSSYSLRFVAFKHVNLEKRKTRITRYTASHDKPEDLMRISWASTIQFTKII